METTNPPAPLKQVMDITPAGTLQQAPANSLPVRPAPDGVSLTATTVAAQPRLSTSAKPAVVTKAISPKVPSPAKMVITTILVMLVLCALSVLAYLHDKA